MEVEGNILGVVFTAICTQSGPAITMYVRAYEVYHRPSTASSLHADVQLQVHSHPYHVNH